MDPLPEIPAFPDPRDEVDLPLASSPVRGAPVAELPEAPSMVPGFSRPTSEDHLPEIHFRDEEQALSSLPAPPPPEAEEFPAPSQDLRLVADRPPSPRGPAHLPVSRPLVEPAFDLTFPASEGSEENPTASFDPQRPPSRPLASLALPDAEADQEPVLPPLEDQEAPEPAMGTPRSPEGRSPLSRRRSSLMEVEQPLEPQNGLLQAITELTEAVRAMGGSSDGPPRTEPGSAPSSPIQYPPLNTSYAPQEDYAIASPSMDVSNRGGIRGAGGWGYGSYRVGDTRANYLNPWPKNLR